MPMVYERNRDYDGRPTVYDDAFNDALLIKLIEVHGQTYADELLLKDAAVREAARQAANESQRHP